MHKIADSFPVTLQEAGKVTNNWAFTEARKIIQRLENRPQKEVIFETGYGPSGLPHIGTFGEVARTSMVRQAFHVLVGESVKSRLIVFSDDRDALRKVPENIPNPEQIERYLGYPLCKIPDPFGTHPSFSAHNNARLCGFLDHFNFEYEFVSSDDAYVSGRFDSALRLMLKNYEEIMAIMLPNFRQERAATYSPFLPLHPQTQKVMQVTIDSYDCEKDLLRWRDPETQELWETPITGGGCKLQWKPDWAMRWHALKIDYEMAGKDLIDSVKLSSAIVRLLGSVPPAGFHYELFLDEKGQKISKSKGNGLTIEQWLTYAHPESLSLFMFQKPMSAKRLYFDVIPRAMEEYQTNLETYVHQNFSQKLNNPVFYIHQGEPPLPERISEISDSFPERGNAHLSFTMLLNLATVANSEDPAVFWGFLRRYIPHINPRTHPCLDAQIHYALRYYRDFVRRAKKYRRADQEERAALEKLKSALQALPINTSAESLQKMLYDVARPIPRYQQPNPLTPATTASPAVSQLWFNTLYQILLGEEKGPRFGSFIELYGLRETERLIDKALNGELLEEHTRFLEGKGS